MDGVELEILWSNLRSLVTEQAKAMQRIAFSPVVREAGDLAYAVFDARGRMVAQADTGTPGHINCLAFTGKYLAEKFAGNCGRVTSSSPTIPGWARAIATTSHARAGFPGRQSHRIFRLYQSLTPTLAVGRWRRRLRCARGRHLDPAGEILRRASSTDVSTTIIMRNVRTPDCAGDLAAQVSSAQAGGEER